MQHGALAGCSSNLSSAVISLSLTLLGKKKKVFVGASQFDTPHNAFGACLDI